MEKKKRKKKHARFAWNDFYDLCNVVFFNLQIETGQKDSCIRVAQPPRSLSCHCNIPAGFCLRKLHLCLVILFVRLMSRYVKALFFGF